MNKKIISLLALAQKAGKIISGEENCEKTLRKGLGKLVIIPEDASDNTKKKFTNKSFFYKVTSYIYGTKEEISLAIGKNNRATIIIVDSGFAKAIEDLLKLQ